MRQVGQFQFPGHGNVAECDAWQPYILRLALHRQVLVVAKTRIEGRWKAYCAPVPGNDHYVEWYTVLRDGAQLPEELARPMFPEFDGVPYAK